MSQKLFSQNLFNNYVTKLRRLKIDTGLCTDKKIDKKFK